MAAVVSWCGRCDMYTDHVKSVCRICAKIERVLARVKDKNPFLQGVKRVVLKRKMLKQEALVNAAKPDSDVFSKGQKKPGRKL